MQDGERPSKYLSGLENKNFIEKTIKKVKLDNGDVITEQDEVLHQVQKYYVNLFENRDDKLQEINFEKLGRVRNLKFSTYLKFATGENTNKINELW